MLKIEQAFERDFRKIWEIQIKAFEKDSLDSSDFSPGNESFEDFYSKREKFIINKICFEESIIGAICIRKYLKESEWKISRIFILPEYQNRKIGTDVLKEIERKYYFVKKWLLETSENNVVSQKFYEKNGYCKKRILKITDNLNTILYEKIIL